MELPKNKEEIFQKLQDFSYYFLKKIEDQFKSSLDVLEGDDRGTGSILATIATIIPVLDTTSAVALSNLVYFHRTNKDETRKILLKAAYEIFTCYEMQFVQLTCKEGPIRAIQKLGYDAAQTFLNYCSANKIKAISEALVIKSIVCETSNFLNSLGIAKFGGTVEDTDENSWKIAKIYTKVGVYDKANATCYKPKGTNTKKYGHRLKFSYETISDDWEKDDLTYDYEQIIDLNDFEGDYPKILQYIIGKDPEEFAIFDGEIKHQQTLQTVGDTEKKLLDDSEIKHQETQSTMVKLHELLKDESSKQYEVITQMLKEIKNAQEIIINELPREPPPLYGELIVEQEMERQEILQEEGKIGLTEIDSTTEPPPQYSDLIVEQEMERQEDLQAEGKIALAEIDSTTTSEVISIKEGLNSKNYKTFS